MSREGRRPLLVVFAKRPEPGKVKTRLCPPFSPDQAAAFYACLLEDVLEESASIARELDLALRLCIHPGDAVEEPGVAVPPEFDRVAQTGEGLAARMAHAFEQAAAEGFGPILVRGSDSPALDRRTVERALDALGDVDVVLCPDLDGGYNLVGLREPIAGLFDHAMSTERVLRDTVRQAESRGRRVALIEAGFDIDTHQDLERLRANEHAMRTCSRTCAYLDTHGLWP